MKKQSGIKFIDHAERGVTADDLGAPRDYLDDVKLAAAKLQGVFTRLQAQARKSKIAFADG